MKKNLFILIIFMIILPVSTSSINLDELINSYNYDYSNSDFNLTLINYNIIDNQINFEIKIDSSNINSTMIYGTKSNLFETNKISYHNLIFGINYINFSLNISYLNKGNYSLYFYVYEQNNNIFRTENLFNFKINFNSDLILNQSKVIENQVYILNNLTNIFNTINFNSNSQKINFNSNSDISIKNIIYNQTNGIAKIEIKNIGQENIIGYSIKIFDENFTKLIEEIIPIILENQTLNLSYNLTKNNSNIFVLINSFENQDINIENNFISYPFDLIEICNDNLDNDRDELIDENCSISKSLEVESSFSRSDSPNLIKTKLLIDIEKIEEEINDSINQILNNTILNQTKFKNITIEKNLENKILKNEINITQFQIRNYSNIIHNETFFEENKIKISGFLVGIISFIFYLLIA